MPRELLSIHRKNRQKSDFFAGFPGPADPVFLTPEWGDGPIFGVNAPGHALEVGGAWGSGFPPLVVSSAAWHRGRHLGSDSLRRRAARRIPAGLFCLRKKLVGAAIGRYLFFPRGRLSHYG